VRPLQAEVTVANCLSATASSAAAAARTGRQQLYRLGGKLKSAALAAAATTAVNWARMWTLRIPGPRFSAFQIVQRLGQ
jgi:hypothetical protein